MENKNYSLIIDYLAKEFNLEKDKLNLNTSLSDIGLDGDDILDFLIKFFKNFDVEYQQTNYKDFIPEESGFFLNTILSFLKIKKNQNKQEIFIKDLVTSLNKKIWYKKL
ncbi:DUF1493 family protein [Cloacibacterium sp. TD35]|uniref:DUF1493 family protein n=1 Tax=Cloacibacterium sp. TD35 TaxID=2976818 RepID=UPI00237E6DB9|nr:DUF1493 family protein [Cloacibacterium sp. TD35]WDT67980.1 DUF1493 family protein [Cloacibacterium sp. TD35]